MEIKTFYSVETFPRLSYVYILSVVINMDNWLGKWKVEKAENFDEYAQAANYPQEWRDAVAKDGHPTENIVKNGDQCAIIREHPFFKNKPAVTEFKLGVAFEVTRPMGKAYKAKIWEEGGKIMEEMCCDSGVTYMTRSFSGGKQYVKVTTHNAVMDVVLVKC